MRDLRKFGERRCADPLCGGIRCDPLRMLALDPFDLAEERVVVGVADLRIILDVVQMIVALDLAPQRFQPLPTSGLAHQEKSRAATALPAGMPCCSIAACTVRSC